MAHEGYIEVHYNDVDNVGEALHAGTIAIRRMLDDLETAIAPLKASWIGVSRDAYDTAKTQWDAAVTDMNLLLRNCRNTLEDMSYNYKRTDLDLAISWAGIR